LQVNSGPISTLTRALADNSQAVNYIPSGTSGCGISITNDQRGVHRPQGGGCDIGAFELEVQLPPVAWLPLIRR
jgi:hypothetical protein